MQNQPKQSTSPKAAVDAPLQKTQRIAGRYEVVEQLVGGMGIVYLCRDHKTNQAVALKTFKPEYLSHRMARDLFLREGTMWVEIGSHPNVVRAFRVERLGDGREVYLVLEWVIQPKDKANPSLRAWLKAGRPLPVDQAILFCLHIARGMRFATQQIPGLIHRDLKPENILVGYDGRARITDFGLASTLSGLANEMQVEEAQAAVGTPKYMAPEQWLLEPLDARADIYALGCILYELVTGRFAADADNREDVREIHLAGEIVPPPVTVPREIATFLHKCLAIDRANRYSNWSIVVDTLAHLYLSVVGEPPPPERVSEAETQQERVGTGYSYNTMGLSYLDIGRLSMAVMYFEQAVNIGREEKDAMLETIGLGNLSRAYTALGYFDRAMEFHEEHLLLARMNQIREQEGRALGNIGRTYRRLGDAQQALAYHEQELAIALETDDQFFAAESLNNLGDTYLALGDDDQATAYFQKSLALARTIGDQTRLKSILNSMGRFYLQKNNLSEAATLFQQALDIAQKIGDHVGEAEAFGNLGDLQQKQKQARAAVEFYSRALNIAEISNDLHKQVSNRISLGDLAVARQALDEARDHYDGALSISQEIGDRLVEVRALGRLAQIEYELHDYVQSARLFKEMQRIAIETEQPVMEQRALIGLGKAFERYGDVQRSASYYEQHLALSRQLGDRAGERTALQLLGDALYRTKQLRTAQSVLENYLALAQAAKDRTAEGDALNKLGQVARERGEAGEAIDYSKKALAIALAKKNKRAEAEALSNMGMAYALQGKAWRARRNGQKGMAAAEQSGDLETIAQTAYRLVLILGKQARWSDALVPVQQAEALYNELADRYMIEHLQKLRLTVEMHTGKKSAK